MIEIIIFLIPVCSEYCILSNNTKKNINPKTIRRMKKCLMREKILKSLWNEEYQLPISASEYVWILNNVSEIFSSQNEKNNKRTELLR
jgi:hypothetical protein